MECEASHYLVSQFSFPYSPQFLLSYTAVLRLLGKMVFNL
jgi:hypothetical protein